MGTNEFAIDGVVNRTAVEADIAFLIEQIKIASDAIKAIKAPRLPIAMGKADAAAFAAAMKTMTDAAVKSDETIARLNDQMKAYEAAMKASTVSTNKAAESNQSLVTSAKNQTAAIKGAATSYEYFANAVEETIRQQINVNKQLEETKGKIKENEASFKAGTISIGDYKEKNLELVKTQKDLKLQTQALTTEINTQLKTEKGAAGSIEQLTNQYNALYVIFKKLSESERSGAGGQELIRNLGALKSNINEIQKQAGNFSANVGRYAESLSPAFKVLENELTSIRAKLAGMNAGDTGFEKLVQEEKALTAITTTLNATLTSTGTLTPTKELRALTNAAKSLGTEFGVTSETFEKFANEVGSRKDELADIQNAINFKASDTKYLDGIVSAVNGLIGVYGAAQAATVLLGDDSEAMQKSMQHLQAILTLVTSLQAVQNAVQSDGAAVQTVLAAKTGLLTAAKKLQAYFTTQAALAAQAEIVADGELAIAQEAVIASATIQSISLDGVAVANTSVAVTAGSAAVAMETEAAAATTAATATTAFSTALTATGIGAIIIAIGAAIAYLVVKTNEWAGSGAKAIEAQTKLAEATGKLNDVLIQQNKIVQENEETFKTYYQNQIALATAAGENEIKLFARRKTLAKENKTLAQDNIDALGATNASYAHLTTTIETLQDKQKLALEELNDFTSAGDDRGAEAAQKLLESYNAQLAAVQPLYEAQKSARQSLVTANAESAQLEIEQAKYEADQLRKLTLALTTEQANLNIDKNERILSNEKSTQSQQISALKNIAAEQRKIANAESAAVQSDPSVSAAEKTIAAKKQSADVLKINREELQQIAAINNEYETRRISARNAANRSILEEDNNLQQALIESDNVSVDQRSKAAERLYANKKALLDQDYNEQLRQAKLTGKTQDEIFAINVDYQTKLVQLTNETQKSVSAIISSELEKQKHDQDEYYKFLQALKDSYDLDASTEYTDQVIALNDSLQKQKIGYEDYLKQRNKLDFQYGQQLLNIQLKNLKQSLDALNDVIGDKIGVEEDYQATIKQLEEQSLTTDNQIEQKKLAEKIKQLKADLAAYKDNIEKKKKLLEELKKAEKDQSDAAVANSKKTREEGLADIAAKIQAYGTIVQSTLGAISEIANIGFDKQKAILEETNAKQEKAYEAEVKRISALNISDAQRADMLSALEVRRTAEKEESDRKLRKIEVERARFEKASNIANIITSTALAVVNALKTSGPLGIALAVAVGALGAAQLARAIATPLPKFAKGTDSAPEGWAITGEKGVEKVIEPSGKSWYTPPTATLTYLKKNSKVIPHHDLIYQGFDTAVAATLNASKPITEESFNMAYISAIENKMDSLINAVNNKPVPTVTNTWGGLQLSIKQGQNIINHKNWYNS